MAFLLAGIGDVHRSQGAYQDALTAYEEGLEIARRAREQFVACYLLDAIGNTHRLTGDHTQAIMHVREALDRARERDATYEVGLYQTSLGVIQYQQGNVGQAESCLRQACDIFERSNAQRELAKASLYLAQTCYVAGHLQDALACVQKVLNCLLQLGYDQFLVPVARETRRVLEYADSKQLAGTLSQQLLARLDEPLASGGRTVVRRAAPVVQPLLRVHGFGEGRVLRGDRPITSTDWGMARSKELLFYLLCHKQRRKDQIGCDLWPSLSPAKLRSSFHVALYRLRRALDQQDCIEFEQDHYFFNRGINYWFDVEEFEKAIRQAAPAWAQRRAEAARAYQRAIVLYSDDFLEGFAGHDWILLTSQELLRKLLLALERLGEYHFAQGAYRDAMGFYDRVLERDTYRENAYRGIMRCQNLLGERSTALRTYNRLAELLARDLETSPAAETTELYSQILQGEVP